LPNFRPIGQAVAEIMVTFQFLGRLLRVDLIVGLKCPSAGPYVRPQKASSISMKYGMYRGGRVMHDGMQ